MNERNEILNALANPSTDQKEALNRLNELTRTSAFSPADNADFNFRAI